MGDRKKRLTRTVTKSGGKKTVTTTVSGKRGSVTRTKTKGGGTKTKSLGGTVGKSGTRFSVRKTKQQGLGKTDKSVNVRVGKKRKPVYSQIGVRRGEHGKLSEAEVGNVLRVKHKKAGSGVYKDVSTEKRGVFKRKSRGRAGRTKYRR